MCIPISVPAVETLRLTGESAGKSVLSCAEFARDADGLDVREMMNAAWLPLRMGDTGGVPSFGYTTDAVWLRFAVANTTANDLDVLLELAVARLGKLDWFVFDGEKMLKTVKGGLSGETPGYPCTRYPVLVFPLPALESRMVYLRVESDTSIWFPITVFQTIDYINHVTRRDFLDYALVGLGLAMFVIALVFGILQWNRLYFFLSMIVVFFLGYHLIFHGYYQWTNGPGQGWVNRQLMISMGMGAMWAFCLFTLLYISPVPGRVQPNVFSKWVSWLMGAGVLVLCVSPFRPGVWLMLIMLGIGLLAGVFIVAKHVISSHSLHDLLFAGVWVAVLLTILLMMSQFFGWTPVLVTHGNLLRVLLLLIYSVFFSLAATQYLREKRRQERVQRAEHNAVVAHLKSLRYQLNPHFLFNTLNSIEALSRSAPDRIPDMIRCLAQYLRLRISPSPGGMVSLKDELDSIQAYLDIERVRFEERLMVAVEVEKGVLACRVPDMLIQPLVENAVKHGMRNRRLELRLVACRSGYDLLVQVINSGNLIAKVDAEREGIGVRNIIGRLKHMYGNRASFCIREEDGRVIAEIRMPCEEVGAS